MQYVREPKNFNIDTVNIETYDGIGMDFSKVNGANAEWYIEQSQDLDQWQMMAENFEDSYQVTYDKEEDVSTCTCSAWRVRNAPQDVIEIKYGTPYSVRAGYKIYDSESSWFPTAEGNGG